MPPSTDQNLYPDLDAAFMETIKAFVLRLADTASQETVHRFRASLGVDNKAGNGTFDPVTEADKCAEAAIRDMIQKTYPDHGIIGEEHGTTQGTSAFSWIIDPIDGTRGFISGVPLWTTLIGCRCEGQPVLGLIDQPIIGDRFVGLTTASTQAAWLVTQDRPQPIKASACVDLNTAILTCTTPEMFDGAERAAFDRVDKAVRLTRYGLDAYGYGLLALGRIDLVVESQLAPYDIQPLIPIIEGAGGVVTDWQGGSAAGGGQVIAAATPELHHQALDVLAG